MADSIETRVQQQFGAVAGHYATSAVHVSGPDLQAMLAQGWHSAASLILDAGAGTCHAALAFAPSVASVTALDLTHEMLGAGQALASEKGVPGLRVVVGDVAAPPLAARRFDGVISRYSAHHWPQPQRALEQLRRLLKTGGWILLSDIVAPERPATDTLLNAIELLRDPSHVRDHTVAQWRAMLAASGFEVELVGEWPVPIDFDRWTTRMATPPDAAGLIRRLLREADGESRAWLGCDNQGNFVLRSAVLAGRLSG